MHGFIHCCLEDMVTEIFGREVWHKILDATGLQPRGSSFVMNEIYSDEMTLSLIEATSEICEIRIDTCLEEYGRHYLTFCQKNGYDSLLRAMGSNLYDFLSNLDTLHEYLESVYPGMKAPSFRVTRKLEPPTGPARRMTLSNMELVRAGRTPTPTAVGTSNDGAGTSSAAGEDSTSEDTTTTTTATTANNNNKLDKPIYLHYHSERFGLCPIVKGLVKAVAKEFFNMNVTVNECRLANSSSMNHLEASSSEGPRVLEHVVLKIEQRSSDQSELETSNSMHGPSPMPDIEEFDGFDDENNNNHHHDEGGEGDGTSGGHASDNIKYSDTKNIQGLKLICEREYVLMGIIESSLPDSECDLLIYNEGVKKTFPFHVVVDRDLNIVQIGTSLLKLTSRFWVKKSRVIREEGFYLDPDMKLEIGYDNILGTFVKTAAIFNDKTVKLNDMFDIVKPKIVEPKNITHEYLNKSGKDVFLLETKPMVLNVEYENMNNGPAMGPSDNSRGQNGAAHNRRESPSPAPSESQSVSSSDELPAGLIRADCYPLCPHDSLQVCTRFACYNDRTDFEVDESQVREAGIDIMDKSDVKNFIGTKRPCLQLKGQMIPSTPDGEYTLFFCAPRVTSLDNLAKLGVSMADMSIYNRSKDLILGSNNLNKGGTQTASYNNNDNMNEQQSKNGSSESEQGNREEVLHNIFPGKLDELIPLEEIYEQESFEMITCVYSTISGFSHGYGRVPAMEVVQMLNLLYIQFDGLASILGLLKVDTICDAYVAIAGLPDPVHDHADRTLEFALDIIRITEETRRYLNRESIEIRVGVHTGPVMAKILGNTRESRYSLFGNTATIASQLEVVGTNAKVLISESTYRSLVQLEKFIIEPCLDERVVNEIPFRTYLVEGYNERVVNIIERYNDINRRINITLQRMNQANFLPVIEIDPVQAQAQAQAVNIPAVPIGQPAQEEGVGIIEGFVSGEPTESGVPGEPIVQSLPLEQSESIVAGEHIGQIEQVGEGAPSEAVSSESTMPKARGPVATPSSSTTTTTTTAEKVVDKEEKDQVEKVEKCEAKVKSKSKYKVKPKSKSESNSESEFELRCETEAKANLRHQVRANQLEQERDLKEQRALRMKYHEAIMEGDQQEELRLARLIWPPGISQVESKKERNWRRNRKRVRRRKNKKRNKKAQKERKRQNSPDGAASECSYTPLPLRALSLDSLLDLVQIGNLIQDELRQALISRSMNDLEILDGDIIDGSSYKDEDSEYYMLLNKFMYELSGKCEICEGRKYPDYFFIFNPEDSDDSILTQLTDVLESTSIIDQISITTVQEQENTFSQVESIQSIGMMPENSQVSSSSSAEPLLVMIEDSDDEEEQAVVSSSTKEVEVGGEMGDSKKKKSSKKNKSKKKGGGSFKSVGSGSGSGSQGQSGGTQDQNGSGSGSNQKSQSAQVSSSSKAKGEKSSSKAGGEGKKNTRAGSGSGPGGCRACSGANPGSGGNSGGGGNSGAGAGSGSGAGTGAGSGSAAGSGSGSAAGAGAGAGGSSGGGSGRGGGGGGGGGRRGSKRGGTGRSASKSNDGKNEDEENEDEKEMKSKEGNVVVVDPSSSVAQLIEAFEEKANVDEKEGAQKEKSSKASEADKGAPTSGALTSSSSCCGCTQSTCITNVCSICGSNSATINSGGSTSGTSGQDSEAAAIKRANHCCGSVDLECRAASAMGGTLHRAKEEWPANVSREQKLSRNCSKSIENQMKEILEGGNDEMNKEEKKPDCVTRRRREAAARRALVQQQEQDEDDGDEETAGTPCVCVQPISGGSSLLETTVAPSGNIDQSDERQPVSGNIGARVKQIRRMDTFARLKQGKRVNNISERGNASESSVERAQGGSSMNEASEERPPTFKIVNDSEIHIQNPVALRYVWEADRASALEELRRKNMTKPKTVPPQRCRMIAARFDELNKPKPSTSYAMNPNEPSTSKGITRSSNGKSVSTRDLADDEDSPSENEIERNIREARERVEMDSLLIPSRTPSRGEQPKKAGFFRSLFRGRNKTRTPRRRDDDWEVAASPLPRSRRSFSRCPCFSSSPSIQSLTLTSRYDLSKLRRK